MAGNGLVELEGLTGCPSLRVLNACANRLTSLKGLARCALLQVGRRQRGENGRSGDRLETRVLAAQGTG